MDISVQSKNRLISKRDEDKFSVNKWAEKHVQPPSQDVIDKMNLIINDYINTILEDFEQNTDSSVKKITINMLDTIRFSFVTEDYEFIIDELSEIGDILDIDITQLIKYFGLVSIPKLYEILGLIENNSNKDS